MKVGDLVVYVGRQPELSTMSELKDQVGIVINIYRTPHLGTRVLDVMFGSCSVQMMSPRWLRRVV